MIWLKAIQAGFLLFKLKLVIIGPENIDCGYEVTQLCTKNCNDNFLGFLNEYTINGTVDNYSLHISAAMNITPFSCHNGEVVLNSSLQSYLPIVTY